MALASASSHCRASFSSSFIGGNAWAKPVTLCVVEPVDGSAPKSPVRTQDRFGGDAMGVNRQIYKQHQHESDQGRVRESRS